ncbi:DDB1- and CUL4-associated factor homolog 1 isoform X2 [Salvia miltiorrhiza]|uniref:DDB1- and CUL4-associated factor homolog 1 isoform X2 n=1 Tax=Salvia miltiorrhiza TaxID=226208 RepID=UPI0025AC7BB4|nr:DDB1- and CUL4-associated factor homolog 1 isoform X2 [Salvia miltiorrhiza]
MEAPTDAEPQTQPEPSAPPAAEGAEERQEEDENDVLMAKAQSLIDKITASPENPSPNVLHALATILETQESSYMESADQSSTSNGRSSHNIGRLGNLIRENEEFFELITSKFLAERRYSVSVQAATTRLLFSCSLTWMYPHVFEDDVLANLRGWVMEEIPRSSGDDRHWKHDTGKRKSSDFEMLRTYSTALLAVCLPCGGQLVEDVLTSGISAKLMRYLRVRVLGDTSTNQKDGNPSIDNKSAQTITFPKMKEDGRGRLRIAIEASHVDADTSRISEKDHDRDAALLDDPARDRERSCRQACADECGIDEETPDSMVLEVDGYEAEADGEEKCNIRDYRESKTKPCGRSHREEDAEENVRDDSSRRKTNRGFSRTRGKVRSSEGVSETEQAITSPSSGSRLGQARSVKDRSGARNQDLRRFSDAKKSVGRNDVDPFIPHRDDNDDCFQNCKVGNKDITDLVKKAVRAAEAEARAANAPAIAIWAAGDDAAEVVKIAALEEYKKTNDEEAAVLAASRAASTVIDAANAVPAPSDSGDSKATDAEFSEDIGEVSIPDNHSLAKLREKFCIQCLVVLGEYVEVLGPVLHEKGVDVSLALLQRSLKHKEASSGTVLLPDILKLICALAAHRKFAALFVDRGGMQRLLAVPRIALTYLGLSSCLFTIGSIQGIMERVCALPSNVIHQIVELALQLLERPQDHQARKNAALFFAAAFVFRAIIDAFDSQDGLQKLLSLLNDAASVRSGVSAGQSSNSGSLRNDRSTADVLTSSEKQIAYHTCSALRQYFRAHLLLLVDSIRPTKNIRSAPRNISRAAYKPLDISNEAMDAVFRQIQKDRKLGPALVRARWPVVDKFLLSNGHTTMLELCQAPPVERYLHDLLQYALGVLHIVTLVPYSRKPIVNATLSNDRVGIAVILDAANGAGYVEPEIVEPALNLLINLVCPPPSISNKPSSIMQGHQAYSNQTGNGSAVESRDKNAERNITERAVNVPVQNEPRERNGEPASVDRGGSVAPSSSSSINNTLSQASSSTVASGLVGDRRISLGAGAGCAGLAAQLEQGYRQARESVRANNGIKVLLQLLQPRMVTSPAALDCLRALTCRVLLGLARDDTIAHILTKLQVGKKLSELIRDSGGQSAGGEQNRWQAELAQVTFELIGVVTNSGRASTLAASDAATPTLRRIERAAIAAATPISYHSRELLLLMHEHLQASGLAESAATLLKEAKLTPLPSLAAPSSLAHEASGQEASAIQIQWPSARAACGFLSDKSKISLHQEDSSFRSESAYLSSKKKILPSSAAQSHSKVPLKPEDSPVASSSKINFNLEKASVAADGVGTPLLSVPKSGGDADTQVRTPIVLPMKRKLTELKESGLGLSVKRLNTGEQSLRSPCFTTPNTSRRSGLYSDATLFCTPISTPREYQSRDIDENQLTGQASSSQLPNDPQPSGSERLTLDSLVVQYLKHQHRQCSAPITTLPPLSLLQPHVCPEPRRSLDAPSNVTSRLSNREFRSRQGGIHGLRKDRQFVYSRFRPWRSCRDDTSSLLTCIAFLGDSSRIAGGGHTGDLKVFDSNSNIVLDSCTSHQSPLTLLQSHFSDENQLILSSSAMDVRLWDASSVSAGPKHSFDGIKAAKFSNSGGIFAALRSDSPRREILLYDTHTCQLDLTLSDTSTIVSGRGQAYSLVHFSPSDSMVLWNGVLWDRRVSGPIHRFDQFTDYGGGGFHPAGNEVIINSEVWDLRKFRLLRSVPSLDQTTITFNASGDVIYGILRRNLEDVTSTFNTRRVKHPLFSAFRTVDAVNYSDIATIPVDRCVLDFATEPTDSFVGLITMDDQDEMYSSARVYEIGRRKPTDDDSDPDDAESEEDEDDEGDDDSILEGDLDVDGDSDADDMSNDDDDSVSEFDDDEEDDGDFMMDGVDFDGGGILEIVTEGDEDDDSDILESFSSGDEDDL